MEEDHAKPRRVPPRRSRRFGVGREIGGCVYVHRQYESVLPREALSAAKAHLPPGWEYAIVKYRLDTGAFSFIASPDFDLAPEPIVGPSVLMRKDGTVRTRTPPRDPEIYHHKWLFVDDDYDGFNLAESRRRTEALVSLEGVDFYRIGKKSYWERHVLPRLEAALATAGRPAS